MSVALTATVLDTQSNQSFERSFERFPVRIGRNQLCDLHVDRAYVSQFHAALEVSGTQIIAKDLGSTNGTVYLGQKLYRDLPVDITQNPELQIGPLLIRLSITEVQPSSVAQPRPMSVLELGTPVGAEVQKARTAAPQAGQEEPFIRQLVPYIEAYRQAWQNVYRLIYEHLTRLQPDVRTAYLKRLLIEHGAVAAEADFQKVSQYYGVPAHAHGELTMGTAAMAALVELNNQLAPGLPPLDDVPKVLGFARRLRNSMEVFMKSFVSLRDGYEEFEAEVLRKERFEQAGNKVGAAKDDKELGRALFAPDSDPEGTAHSLHEIYVEVMTHQVALLNGVMEGAKELLDKLSPAAVERAYEAKGKKGGLFSNKYEGLWQEYQTVHSDYTAEDKETFLIIFGPQFSRAYAATTGEAYSASGDPAGVTGRGTAVSVNQRR
jgi:type VI secretion system protein ImpI